MSDFDDGRYDHRSTPIRVVDPTAHGTADRPRAAVSSGITGLNASGSSEKPFAETLGSPTTLPVTESITTVAEMKPPSPRMRRSVSSDSLTSPTASPSTYTYRLFTRPTCRA